MKTTFLILLFTLSGIAGFAQDSTTHVSSKADRKQEKRQRINAIIKQEEEGNLSFRKQSIFGIQLRTNGYGLFYEMGRRKSERFTNIYTAELTEIKHPKEDKLSGQNFFGNSYVYGKINNFYQFKLGLGEQYIFGQKGNKNGVAIIGSVQGGIDLGFLKPYYLQVFDTTGELKSVTYDQDSLAFLDRGSINGAAGFTKGWNEVKLKPGFFIKTSLRFDFGRYNEMVQALEIGMSVEYFTSKIPIVLYNDPRQLFFQGHIAFAFGRRK
ncbi:MAG TPA: hypothetical protein VFQ58_11150 [Flavisolibacter sp.]|nr:hypothetical protein [Flavisolibacter sp.]